MELLVFHYLKVALFSHQECILLLVLPAVDMVEPMESALLIRYICTTGKYCGGMLYATLSGKGLHEQTPFGCISRRCAFLGSLGRDRHN